MLLILTNSKDATADYLCSSFQKRNIAFLRLDTENIVTLTKFQCKNFQPTLLLEGIEYTPHSFSHVWYRRPERLMCPNSQPSPEQDFALEEWAESMEGFLSQIPVTKWMNHPAKNALASHKIDQLITAQSFGLTVPDTLITQDADAFRTFFDAHQQEVIVKPLAGGYVERPNGRDSLIYTNQILCNHLDDLTDLQLCPTFFQAKIRKRADVRLTVVDHNMHALILSACDSDGRQRCDIRRNNMEDVAYEPAELPTDIREKVESLMQHYNLRFGAIDFCIDEDGQWIFFEINPNGQWAWMDLAGASNIIESFVEAFR